MPSEKSIASAREKVRLKKEKQEKTRHLTYVTEKRKKPTTKKMLAARAAAEAAAAAPDGAPAAPNAGAKEVLWEDGENEISRLDKLFAMAMSLEHPGIDQEGIDTMKRKVADEQFKAEHFIDMWTKRLEVDCGVVVRTVSESGVGAAAPGGVQEDSGSATAAKEVVFEPDEAEMSRLDQLLAMAMALEHPGIDQEGIDTMKQKVADGQFNAAHYIDMWTKRLAKDMGVVVRTAPPARKPLSVVVGKTDSAILSPTPITAQTNTLIDKLEAAEANLSAMVSPAEKTVTPAVQ